MNRKRPTVDGHHGSSVTTPLAASLIQLLGSPQVYKSVAFSRDEWRAINRVYGFKPEPPTKKPEPPKKPEPGDYPVGYEYRQALQEYERALERHSKWEDPQALMQAGADRNLTRYAEEDGLRLLAWLAKHLDGGDDPLKKLIILTSDAGWDVDPEDLAWAESEEPSTEEDDA